MIVEGWDHYLHGSNPHDVRVAVPTEIHHDEEEIAKKYAISKTSKATPVTFEKLPVFRRCSLPLWQ